MKSSPAKKTTQSSISNSLFLRIARKRWTKRIMQKVLPSKIYCDLWESFRVYFDPRDYRGPSFHLAYDLEKGFENYEIENKKSLLAYLEVKDPVFMDVGANIGLFTLWFKRQCPHLKIFAFEYNKRSLQNSIHVCYSQNQGKT